MDRTDDVVIVTGAGGNLGAAVARVLAAEGRRLVLVDRSGDKLERAVADLGGGEILPVAAANLADPAEAEGLVARTLERFGGVGALVNTIGGFAMGRVAGGEALGQWDRMMEANARIALVLSAAVLPAMVERRYGRIVHVSAGAALKAGAGLAAYAAAKAALLRLTEAIAAEHRGDGIAANCILPGTIDTPENRAAMPKANRDGWVAPEAIARLAAFLASPAGGVVTGAAVPATGPA